MTRELSRAELRYLHHQALYIVGAFPEFFPDVPRPAVCVFNAPKARPGTLAGLMQEHAR